VWPVTAVGKVSLFAEGANSRFCHEAVLVQAQAYPFPIEVFARPVLLSEAVGLEAEGWMGYPKLSAGLSLIFHCQ